MKKNYSELISKCREIVKCDTARISKPIDKMFLIIGFNRNTNEDEGKWIINGRHEDFDYVSEQTIASGNTEEELLDSVKEYKRLCEISWDEYFEDLKQNS